MFIDFLFLFTSLSGRPAPESSDQLTIREALESQGDLPFLVITVAAVVGTILLLLNIILIGCFIHKKNKNKAKKQERAPSSEGKTKCKYTKKQPITGEGPYKYIRYLCSITSTSLLVSSTW